MSEEGRLLAKAARRAQEYLDALSDRKVNAIASNAELRRALGVSIERGGDPVAVIDALADAECKGIAQGLAQ